MLEILAIAVLSLTTPLVPHRHAAPSLSAAWGGDLASEASAAIESVQKAMQLCQALGCEMEMATSDATGGKEMDACDMLSGVSFIKEGDSTPVTAADVCPTETPDPACSPSSRLVRVFLARIVCHPGLGLSEASACIPGRPLHGRGGRE